MCVWSNILDKQIIVLAFIAYAHLSNYMTYASSPFDPSPSAVFLGDTEYSYTLTRTLLVFMPYLR